MKTPDIDVPALEALAAALKAEGRLTHHRRAVALIGPRAWGRAVAERLAPPEAARYFEADEAFICRARAELGTSIGDLVLDLHEDLHPNALGALSGTVKGGGLMIFLLPERWGKLPQRAKRLTSSGGPAPRQSFPQRLRRALEAHALVLRPDRPPPGILSGEESIVPEPPDAFCKTDDQMRAVAALLKVAAGRKRRPAVLTSDRGRGKSAALGIAAGFLLKKGRSVLLTAPQRASVDAVFERAAYVSGAPIEGNRVERQGATLRFISPNQLITERPEADIVFVDEAAALPVPILEQLLSRYNRIAFATTIHGYEGTGRGFALRFHEVLRERTPDWKGVQLRVPIRWAEGDPLERMMFDLLLLDATPPDARDVAEARPEECEVERLDAAALAKDEATLRALFGLLVIAHYRTSPADLERLLDATHMELFALRWRGLVVGAALIGREGGLSADLSAAIYEGRRRPRGHLLPETLSAHLGVEEAPQLRALRVIRIAVHPSVQARGLGGRLLAGIIEFAAAARIDYVGSSFGATPKLLRFWTQSGLQPIRVGVQRGKSTGERSVVVVRPISDKGRALLSGERARLLQRLPDMLMMITPDMEPELVAALMAEPEDAPPDLDERAWRDLCACAYGGRGFALTVAPARALVVAAVRSPEFRRQPPEARALLIRKALLGHSWDALVEDGGFDRAKDAVVAFNEALRPWIQRWGGPEAEAWAARFAQTNSRLKGFGSA